MLLPLRLPKLLLGWMMPGGRSAVRELAPLPPPPLLPLLLPSTGSSCRQLSCRLLPELLPAWRQEAAREAAGPGAKGAGAGGAGVEPRPAWYSRVQHGVVPKEGLAVQY